MSARRALAAAAVLAGSVLLGACGGDVQDTACSDFTAMSASDRRDLLVELATDAGSDNETFLDASTDDQDAAVDVLVTACADADGDPTIDDVLDPLID
ncbi:hypothetical protein ABFT23_18595 [Nocardioides sp. C4-1]|uniref:hypothetical protein n=1 Tax=Nocardioides sp. C4-1 TaxID=3151851 RepID=UPI003266FEEF